MKKYFTFIMVLVCAAISAQNMSDVLRFSIEDLQGTARYQGLSGAFGALGGDLSAINVNPASSAVFKNSQFTMTGTNYNRDNTATYFDGISNLNLNSFKINQAGGVFVFKSYTNSDWKKVSLAFNYDLAQNFKNDFFAVGNGNEGIDNYFLNFADGVPFGSLLIRDNELIEEAYLDVGASLGYGAQQAFLGYFGGVIDPVDANDPNNTLYVSNAQYNTVSQDYYQAGSGYNSKFTMNLGTQYQDHLYLGASLNFHNVLYERYTRYSERGFDAASPVQFINFDNLLITHGGGFSFGLGLIAKLNESIRFGGSYQSPTWYDLADDSAQRINSDLADEDIGFIDFNIINLFQSYKVKTPAKFTGSMAVIFGKQGLLSFDYGYQDMSKSELRPTADRSFSTVNTSIRSDLGPVSTFKVGGEYRVGQLSLRGGYRFEESPYIDALTMSDLNGFSAGLGYNFGGSRFDFTYSRSDQDVNEQLFETGINTPAMVNYVKNNFIFSYTINF